MSVDSTDFRHVRLAQNQSLFRSVNERVETVAPGFSTDEPINFFCECPIQECTSYVQLSRGDYEAIRRNPARFFVLPEHVFPEVEVVVADHERYVVVEKFGVGGRVAAATDPRQRSD